MQPLLQYYDQPTDLGHQYGYESSRAYLFHQQEAPALEYECVPDQDLNLGPAD